MMLFLSRLDSLVLEFHPLCLTCVKLSILQRSLQNILPHESNTSRKRLLEAAETELSNLIN
jgi:hypothetical protein